MKGQRWEKLSTVCYDVASLRDSIENGQTGVLVNSGNVEDLAEAIIKVLEDDELTRAKIQDTNSLVIALWNFW
jgi:glycosyltransferase involved in cell wall biosynthesis